MFLTNLPLNRHESSSMLLSQGGQFDRVAKPGVETKQKRKTRTLADSHTSTMPTGRA
jgi:hypothetical protein